MRLKKILIVLSIPVMAEIAIACCDCLETISKNYSHKSIVVQHLDNSGEKPEVTYGSVPKHAYGVRVTFTREVVACRAKQTPTFFQSAYAFSCDCPPELTIAPKDSIVSIHLFAEHDFDPSHPADSDVSDYFKVYFPDAFSFTSIEDYLQPVINYRGYSNLVLFDESQLEEELTLLLMTPPENTVNKFRIQITLSDGRIFEQTTEEIDLI